MPVKAIRRQTPLISQRISWTNQWKIIAILGLAFWLRVKGLGARSLWFDESIEYWMAAIPIRQIPATIAASTHDPPLYSILLHFWLRGGLTEFWLRFPSMITSLLSVVFIYIYGKMVGGKTVGAISAFLLALNVADIRYAQEAGQYAFLVLSSILTLIFLQKAIHNNEWKWWGLWGSITALSLNFHYGSFVFAGILSSLSLLWLFWRKKRQTYTRMIITTMLVAILSAPLLFWIVPRQFNRLGVTEPLVFSWLELLNGTWQIMIFQWVGNRGFWDVIWEAVPLWFYGLPLIAPFCLAFSKTRSLFSPPILLILSLLGYYLISRTGGYFFSPSRHSLFLAPLLMVSLGIGIHILMTWRNLAGFITIGSIAIIALAMPLERGEDLKSVTHRWQLEKRSDDTTFVYYGAAPGFSYQLDVAKGAISQLPTSWFGSCYAQEQIPACGSEQIYYGSWSRHVPAEEQRARIDAQINPLPQRLWLIFSHTVLADQTAILDGLAPDYEKTQEFSYDNASLILMEQR